MTIDEDHKYFQPTLKLNLTGSEMSTILYIMEGYLSNTDDSSDTAFTRDCDRIFAELESVTDNFYASLESVTQ